MNNIDETTNNSNFYFPIIKDYFNEIEPLSSYSRSTRLIEIIPEHISNKIGCYPSSFVFGSENVVVTKLLERIKDYSKDKIFSQVNAFISETQTSYLFRVDNFYVYITGMYFISLSNLSRLNVPKNVSIDVSKGKGPLIATSVSIFYNPEDSCIVDFVKSLAEDTSICLEEKSGDIYIELITKDSTGFLTTKSIPLKSAKTDLALNYGPSFPEFDHNLLKKLSTTNKGIMMFHGEPGTGKTSYIRNLVPKLTTLGKRVLLIPKHIIGAMESPDFNEFMLSRFTGGQEIIFVVEDAEALITSKNSDGSDRSSLISTILNLSDGILNDIFHISIILTFNTKIVNIDEALLRKGRLLAKYEFAKLTGKDFLPLAESLGIAAKIKEDAEYALSDIYALTDEVGDQLIVTHKKEKKVMGL